MIDKTFFMQEIQRYLKYLRSEKNASPHTITAYSKDLEQFALFLNDNEIALLSSVTSKNIRSWISELHLNGISPKSIHRKVSSVRSFFKFLLKNKIVEANPTIYVVLPKIPKRLPLFVKETEMEHLLDNIETEDSYSNVRNKLIVEMFYGTGMRLSELVELKEKDIYLEEKIVKVLGKGNKERLIPLTNESIRLLKQYNKIKKETFPHIYNGWLFLTNKGEKIYHKLVYRVVNSSLSKVTTLQKKSPHILRHTYATVLLDKGADLNAVKELLGHSSLKATEIYTHNTIEKINKIYKQAHPRA